jgi:molybdenum cofactor cytidylyltransferase
LTGVLILATGAASAKGQLRQLLPFRGKSILRRVTETALSLERGPVAVLIEPGGAAMRDALSGLPVHFVENPNGKSGSSASLQTGLNRLLALEPALSGLLILLCDQPIVGANPLRALLDAPSGLSAAAYLGTTGIPAWISRTFFGEIRALRDGESLQTILHRHQKRVLAVPLPEAAMDIDFIADLTASSQD